MTTLPTTSAQISADWLNSVLSDATRGGARVTDVSATVIGEGVGFLGEVARLELTYDHPTPESTTAMISKLPTANEGFKHMGLLLGFYEKEAGFYRDIASEIELRIPRCYANEVEGGVHFALLLEDLAPMRPGNQLASCSLAEAEMALAAAAKLHARWWQSPELDDFSTWLPDASSPYFEILKGAFLGAVDKFHRDFSYLVSPEVDAFVDVCAADYDAMTDAGVGRNPHTFIHGDFRLDNMMFGDHPDQAPFALLDFQLPFRANPLWDVVYFLGGNFDPEWRRTHQDALVAGYHRELVANGVNGYSLDQCREDYRAAGLVLMGYLVTGAADVELSTLNERGRELMETMFTRYSTTVTDLGSAEFL